MQTLKPFCLQISRKHEALLLFTQQPLQFYHQFYVSLTISDGSVTLDPLATTIPINFQKACSSLLHLCSIEIGEYLYNPKQVNEVENEYYRGLSNPKMRQLMQKHRAVLVPRMAIRDILGSVDGRLKYYFVTRSKPSDLKADLSSLQILREKDQGNKQLDRLSIANKTQCTISIKKFICLILLGVKEFVNLTDVVYKNEAIYYDPSINPNDLEDIAQEYVVQELEMPFKNFFNLISQPQNIKKFNLSRTRLIHQIQYINEVNKYCYVRAVRQDRVYYIRHRSYPILNEIVTLSEPVAMKKYLILELGELQGIKINSYVETEMLKYLQKFDIEKVLVKNDLLLVSYTSQTNINGKILALLNKLRKVFKIPISLQVKDALEKSFYKSRMDRLANQNNVLWKLLTTPKGYYLTLRGVSGSAQQLINQINTLISQFSIYTFRINTEELSKDTAKQISSKFRELLSQLPLKNSQVITSSTQIEINGIVSEQHQVEDVVTTLVMCLKEMGVTEGIIEEKTDFQHVEVQFEESLLVEEENQVFAQQKSLIVRQESQVEDSQQMQLQMLQSNINISGVEQRSMMLQQSSIDHDEILKTLTAPRRQFSVPELLLEDLKIQEFKNRFDLNQHDGQWKVTAYESNDLQRFIQLLANRVVVGKSDAKEQSLLKVKRDNLSVKFEGRKFTILSNNYKERRRAWKLCLINILRFSDVDIFEGFFANGKQIRGSEIPAHKQDRITYGQAGEADGRVEHFQQFQVELS